LFELILFEITYENNLLHVHKLFSAYFKGFEFPCSITFIHDSLIFRFVIETCRRLKEKKSYMVYTAVGCLGVSALSDIVKEVLEPCTSLQC